YNTFYNRDSVNSQSPTHGTIVSGLIAAKGNNITGVSGVAWNAKILRVNGVTDNWDGVTEAIKGYDYCISMRKLYTSSNKQKGAYIVAVNFSIGQDNGNPDDNPLWGAMYDSLAKVGILAVCAVSNSSKDALVAGDLPTLFHKPHMITVTTLDRATLGLSSTLGAYSTKYVNISAPHISYTTLPGDRFGTPSSPGTSFSTPLVTGAIALMYSNFSPIFLDSLSKNPSNFSLKIKEMLLANVDKTNLLATKVSSGGKLNLFKTILGVRRYNDSIKPKANLVLNALDQYSIYSSEKNIILKKSNNIPLSISVCNILGQIVLRKKIDEFESIIPCQNLKDGIYIVQIETENELKSTKLDLR
ncbi:MAG: S8 family serine peptidase, partial [Chitinophagales bacterium]